MIPIVVVQPPEPPPSAEAISYALNACTSGLPRGRCVLESDVALDHVIQAIAVIHVLPDGSMRVEVAAAAASDREIWVREVLNFSESDPEEERWKAAGFLTSSLATTQGDFEAPPKDPELETLSNAAVPGTPKSSETVDEKRGQHPSREAASPDDSDPKKVVSSPRDQAVKQSDAPPNELARSVWVAVGPQLSVGLAGRSLRAGPMVRAGIDLWRTQLWLTSGVGWSGAWRTDEGVSIRAWSLEAGLVAPMQLAPDWGVAAHGRFTVDSLIAQAVSEEFATSHQLSRWMLGSSWGGSIVYMPASGLGLTLIGDVLRFNGGTTILLAGEPVGSVPGWNFRLFLGVRHDF